MLMGKVTTAVHDVARHECCRSCQANRNLFTDAHISLRGCADAQAAAFQKHVCSGGHERHLAKCLACHRLPVGGSASLLMTCSFDAKWQCISQCSSQSMHAARKFPLGLHTISQKCDFRKAICLLNTDCLARLVLATIIPPNDQ